MKLYHTEAKIFYVVEMGYSDHREGQEEPGMGGVDGRGGVLPVQGEFFSTSVRAHTFVQVLPSKYSQDSVIPSQRRPELKVRPSE